MSAEPIYEYAVRYVDYPNGWMTPNNQAATEEWACMRAAQLTAEGMPAVPLRRLWSRDHPWTEPQGSDGEWPDWRDMPVSVTDEMVDIALGSYHNRRDIDSWTARDEHRALMRYALETALRGTW